MILLNDWAGKTANDVFKEFDGERWRSYRDDDAVPVYQKPAFAGFKILLASYTYEDYSGDAFVLCKKDGVLYEVNGSHCSCYGLEGQWAPEATTKAALVARMRDGRLGIDWQDRRTFADELAVLLKKYRGA